ncbi:MAG: SH3 domain-containing protein, partial [Chloroflexi bacterium]|nr:SH3 domain-containing protein [Chloroflexota bacterium]
MNRKIALSLVLTFCAGCAAPPAPIQATEIFSTATLPPTTTPQATPSLAFPTTPQPEEKVEPVAGITATQLNVRDKPSAAGKSLGMIGVFSKVQIVGKAAGGGWYQILYAEAEGGKGWVRAEYVQVQAGDALQIVEVKPDSASGILGLVAQKVNVRKEAGTDSETLGTLNPQDLVFITGRNADGKWLQIEFAAAPEGRGWVAAEFVQAEGIEDAPQIGKEGERLTPAASLPTGAAAALDSDTIESPLAVVLFSPAASRAAQWDGSLSALEGDSEDWLRFSAAFETVVAFKARCANNAL